MAGYGRKRNGRNGQESGRCGRTVLRYNAAMLWNVIDKRTRPYRWREVNAIVEAVEHDNSCADADQAPESDPLLTVDYKALEAVSVQEAVAWANGQRCPVTLYLYDLDRGFANEEHFNEVGNRFPKDSEEVDR
jgi:hypothetical protein